MSKLHLKTDSLAFSLICAARAVAQVKSGTALPQALSAMFAESQAPGPARGAIQDIAYRTMRQLGRAETLLQMLTDRPPSPAPLHALLCCGLALMCESDAGPDVHYDSFTLVDQAVTACAASTDIAHAKGMVNAVLRRFLRERETLMQKALRQPAAHWNYPSWWIDAMKAAYPHNWQAILDAGNRAPPLTLRINQRRTTVEAYRKMLISHGIASDQIGPVAIRLHRPLPVLQIPGFEDGLVSVQDAGAQMAAPLLDLHDGMRVLDACAAPGGKTGHILESADVDLLALDSDVRRLVRIEENLQRLQLRAAVKNGDAGRADWWNGQPFDRILADVPCTASGIVRRHPDIRWLRRKSDTENLATLSGRILDNLWQMLGPDGKLLFVTCSVWPAESEMQAAAFAVRNKAMRLPAPGQLMPAAEAERDHDGLFYALFQKPSASPPRS